MTATIPEGTSVIDARFEDALDADLELAATPTWVFAGVPNDPSWTIHASTPAIGGTGTIRLDRAGTYTNAAGSGDDTLVVTIVARVRNVGATAIADTTPNTGTFSWLPDNVVGTTRSSVTSNSVTATVREPSITLAKDENDTDDIVAPNDSLTYTLTVGAASGTNRSAAHDLVVVDTIPAGITVVNGGVPVADGGAVNPDGGIWNQGAHDHVEHHDDRRQADDHLAGQQHDAVLRRRGRRPRRLRLGVHQQRDGLGHEHARRRRRRTHDLFGQRD